jgi:exodeoxyribonuclease V beta subunit
MSARRAARPALLGGIPLNRHAVIEASAGTGKTFTLEHLIVELVLAAEVTLDQVLVVTFTEKATHELRVRVRGKLEELLRGEAPEPDAAAVERGDFWTLDEAACRKLERALHAFDGATIATIHAFCQRVLRDNAFASGRLFEESQVDGRDAFGRALRDALRRDIATDPVRAPWLEAALRAGWSLDTLEGLLWSCTLARGELRPVFDPQALRAAIDAFPVDDALQRDGVDTLKSWGVHGQTAKKLGNQLYELAMAVERARDSRDPAALVVDPGAVEVEYLLEKLPGLDRPGPTGRACAAALALAEITPTLGAALANIVLPPVRAELSRRKRQAGQYDFDDMLSLVQDGLKGARAGALVRSMRERYRFVLIDEFQDTDETQWDIFRRAFFEPEEGAPRSVLHLVGDPKQSIYRFRGADVQTYLQARDEVARSDGELLRLGRNFRATPQLVDATNALFDPSASSPFFTGTNAYAPVACGRPERSLLDGLGRQASPLHAFRFEREVHAGTLGALVAREIGRILDTDRPWTLDGRALEPQDVFILTRTRSEGRAMGAALRAAGVPYAFYKEDGLFQTDEAREIRTLLAAIVDPDDRAARLAAWMTRFFALPLEDLERARALPPTHPYVARLEAWKVLADARDFEHLFQSIVRDSGVVRREIFFADGERELTNTLHIFELLLEQARRAPGTLQDLLLLLGGLVDGSRLPLDLEGNVQRLESERRAVQIMTVHKSKGLEAAVVFMAGGWSGARTDDVRILHQGGRRIAWVGRMRADVKPLAAEEEREEDQRLMYVALTRAKGRLYVPLVLKDGEPAKMRGAYDAVNRRVAELVAASSPLVTVESPSPATHLRLVPDVGAESDPWRPPAALLAPDAGARELARLRERHAGDTVTSYTRMRASHRGARSAWSDEPVDRRAEKAQDEIDPSGSERLRPARASGVFVHEVLERVPLASFASADLAAWRARPEVSSLFDEATRIHRVDPRQRPHAEQLVWSAFATAVTLPAPGDAAGPRLPGLARAARVAREMEFVFPVEGARTFVRGSLDLAFDHAGLTYFVDWKTDSLDSFAPGALAPFVQSHYADQVSLYALATVRLLGVRSREEYDARFGGILYFFLRGLDASGAGIWSTRPTWDQVTAWEQQLRRRTEGRR